MCNCGPVERAQNRVMFAPLRAQADVQSVPRRHQRPACAAPSPSPHAGASPDALCPSAGNRSFRANIESQHTEARPARQKGVAEPAPPSHIQTVGERLTPAAGTGAVRTLVRARMLARARVPALLLTPERDDPELWGLVANSMSGPTVAAEADDGAQGSSREFCAPSQPPRSRTGGLRGHTRISWADREARPVANDRCACWMLRGAVAPHHLQGKMHVGACACPGL